MSTAVEIERLERVPTLDETALSVIRDCGPRGPALLEQVARAWLRDLPARVAQARGALDAGERNLAHCIVHSLKSCSATVGAARVARRCGIAEAACKRGDLGPELLDGIEREFRTAAIALRQRLKIGVDRA